MDEQVEEIEIITLKGFEENNEPEIRIMSDGTIYLVFNFFPPESFDMSMQDINSFNQELSDYLEVKVIHEDREFFYVHTPLPTSVSRIKTFIETYKLRKKYLIKSEL
jgi:hypothetical protein